MKSIILTLSILILSVLLSQAAKKIDAHPINIAVSLVEKSDSAKVASTLEYYGYSFDSNEDEYVVMKDSKGNEIRYTFTETNSPIKYPIVTVKTHETHKEIDSRLKELNFEKVGKGYDMMRNHNSRSKINCTFGPSSTLIIRRISN